LESNGDVEMKEETENKKIGKSNVNLHFKRLELNEKLLAINIAKSKGNQYAA
jgi:hypothetical protein